VGFLHARKIVYGTVSVMFWLFELVPDDAVTVIVYVPAGVPLTGVCVVLWLQAGKSRSNAKIVQSMDIPTTLRRRRSPPIPKNAIPGITSQNASKCRLKRLAAGVMGRAVVGIVKVTVEPLELCNVTEVPGLKAHDEPAGVPVQDIVIGEPNSGCGVSETV